MKRIRTALALAAIALAPLGVASPAQATTTFSGCTVNPHIPAFRGEFTVGGVKRIEYEIEVTCDLGLTVETDQVRGEQDTQDREGDIDDDVTGTTLHTWDFTTSAATQSLPFKRALVQTGPATEGPDEEVYQQVRFRVTNGPVTSPWTDYELTLPRTILR